MITEKEILKEKMVAYVVFFGDMGYGILPMSYYLYEMVGSPEDLDITAALGKKLKKKWSTSKYIDYLISFME